VPNADQTSRRSAMILPVERKWSPLGGPLQGCRQAPRASSSPGLEGVEPRMRSEALLCALCAVSTALQQTFTALLRRPPLGLDPAHLEVQTMGSRLLLAIDQYAPGHAPVDFTVDLASMSKSDVYVFHVREVPSSLGVFPLESAAEAQVLVEETVRRLQSAGIAAEGEACSEHKSRVALLIVEEALKRKCNAIVLGSLRLRGLQSMIGHGTRERVLKMSSLPVIVTPPALCANGRSGARL